MCSHVLDVWRFCHVPLALSESGWFLALYSPAAWLGSVVYAIFPSDTTATYMSKSIWPAFRDNSAGAFSAPSVSEARA